MKNRNIALAIVFSIITCGIYGIYWFVVLTNDMNSLSTSDGFETSGGMALLFTIITCGIYGFFLHVALRKLELKHTYIDGEPISVN